MKKHLKSVISVILSLSLLCCLFSVITPVSATNDLEIYVASDLHYVNAETEYSEPAGNASALPGNELYSHVNAEGKFGYESYAMIKSMLADFVASDSNILFLSGDITNNGNATEHESLSALFNEVEASSGKRIYVVPGNHDIWTEDNGTKYDIGEFVAQYYNFGYDEAIEFDEKTGSYVAKLDDNYRLLALNSMKYEGSAGEITDELMAWISVQAKQAKADGKKLIAMMHHGLLDHFGNQALIAGSTVIDNNTRRASALADLGIKYIFTGHLHTHSMSVSVSAAGNKIYDIETGALAQYPNAFRSVTFSDEAVVVKTMHVDSIDVNDLPDGFNEQQKAAMSADFSSYAKNYFRAALELWVPKYISASVFAKAFDTVEGTPAYTTLESLAGIVNHALSLPLYDTENTPETDSIEEIAAIGGVSIPESDYESIIDVIFPIILEFYSGDADMTMDSPEVEFFFACFKGALSYAIYTLANDNATTLGITNMLNAMGIPMGSLVESMPTLMFSQTTAGLIVATILTPIVEGVISDEYAPADNNATLEAYGVNNPLDVDEEGVAASTIQKLFYRFIQLLEWLRDFLNGLFSLK